MQVMMPALVLELALGFNREAGMNGGLYPRY